MTIKDAIFYTLENLKIPANYQAVTDYIVNNNLSEFGGPTPNSTVSAQLGDFIRKGDGRVGRIKKKDGGFLYYLTKFQDIDLLNGIEVEKENKITDLENYNYSEYSLHKLLSSYLKNNNIYSKTISHEKSKSTKDENQVWTHPDVIGLKLLPYKNKASKDLLQFTNSLNTFELHSYEVKREILSDYDLKKTYFQAVSNSSWATFGYLAAFEINISLFEEMERLNQSFGIGIINLKGNPYESRLLLPPKQNNLDFRTIDKLCNMNPNFQDFIHKTHKLIKADNDYFESTKRDFEVFCDPFFKEPSEYVNYCKSENIPVEDSKDK